MKRDILRVCVCVLTGLECGERGDGGVSFNGCEVKQW